jgi:hypothetical protein
LINLKDGPEFNRLSTKQRREVAGWIEELKVIAQLHKPPTTN